MKLFKKIFSMIMAGAFVLGTSVFSTSSSDTRNYEVNNTSLISNEMGGGGTPSIDEPDGEKPKVFPQPEVEFDDQDYVIVSWKDVINEMIENGEYTEPERDNGIRYISSAYDWAWVGKNSNTNDYYTTYILTQDIYMNDGYFDKNGNYHDGGDGILYDWPHVRRDGMKIDGKGFGIYNLYSGPKDNVGTYLVQVLGSVKDIHLNVCLISLNYASQTFGNINSLSNVEVSGYISGKSARGLSDGLRGNAENCTNRAIIVGNSGPACGLVGLQNAAIIENCKNYGKIISKTSSASGIINSTATGVKLKNCKNYGEITALDAACGISYQAKNWEIIDCENYGTLTSTRSRGAGIVYFCSGGGSYTFSGCKSYGYVNGSYLIGYISGGSSAKVLIENCYFSNEYVLGMTNYKKDTTYHALIGECYGGTVEISNVRIVAKGITNNPKIFGWLRSGSTTFNVKNTQVDIQLEKSATLSFVQIENNANPKILNLKNVLVNLETNFENTKWQTTSNNISNLNKVNADNVLIRFVSTFNKGYYYGTDFSAFYVKWKTGEIGLKALDSVGAYMFAIPSEEYLQSRGFTKVA